MAKVAEAEEYNVLVLGLEKVGKTSLLNKYLHDEFTEDTGDLQTTNECGSIVINKKEIAMQFWEVAGAVTYHMKALKVVRELSARVREWINTAA